jgi:uncharacterized membrane protein
MQCPACHNEVSPQSAFCSQCGAPLASGGGAAAAVPPPPNYTNTPPAYSTVPPAYAAGPHVGRSTGLSENGAAAIAYLTIIPAIIFLVLEPYNKMPLVRFHSWQSIGLCAVTFLIQTFITIMEIAVHFIPGIVFLFGLVHLAIGAGLFLIWLFIILKAAKGEWYKLPVIGDFAEKQAHG